MEPLLSMKPQPSKQIFSRNLCQIKLNAQTFTKNEFIYKFEIEHLKNKINFCNIMITVIFRI